MNKIYKVIWNRVRGCYMVVSELVKRNHKNSGGCSSVSLTGVLCAAAVAGAVLASPLPAGAVDNGPGTGPGTTIGTGSVTNKVNDVTVGRESTAKTTGSDIDSGAVAIGVHSKALGKNSTALGYKAQASIIYSGAGTQEAIGSTAIGAFSVGGADYATALGQGANVQWGGNYSVALGQASVVNRKTADIQSGYLSGGKTDYIWKANRGVVSIGHITNSEKYTRQIMGLAAGTEDTDAVNVAQLKAAYTHYYSVNSSEQGNGSNYANDGATGTNSLAAGVNVKASGTGDVAIGYGAKTEGNQQKAIAIGAEAKATGNSQYAMAIGAEAQTSVQKAAALGYQASVTVQGGVALGAGSAANRSQSSSAATNPYIPSTAGAAQQNAVNATKATDGAVSIGSSSVRRQIINVAAGSADTDAVNVAQLKAAITAASPAIHDYSVNSVNAVSDTNYNNGGATGADALAAGVSAAAQGKSAAAVGKEAKAIGDNSLALGLTAQAKTAFDTAIGGGAIANGGPASIGDEGGSALAIGTKAKAEGTNAISIGNSAQATQKSAIAVGGSATGDSSTTLGYVTTASGSSATAVGYYAQATANQSTALGTIAKAETVGAVAIGNGARAAASEGDVALGAGSETAAAVGTASYTINGQTKGFAGTGPASTVSVGKAGTERTITNVAAGRISGNSTDAVNGSQLFGVIEEVNKGIKYGGDTGAVFTRRLGEQTNVKGGKTAGLTENNIGVVSDGTDTLTVKLSKDVNLGSTGSLQAGGTTINSTGIATNQIVAGGTTINSTTFDAGNKQITNVASGGSVTNNAATIGDVNTIVGNKAKWTIQDAEAVPGSKQIDAATPLVVEGDAYVKTKVDNSGLHLSMDENKLNSQITNQITNNTTVNQHGTDITALKAGFTVSNEAGTKQDITLGGAAKQDIQFVGEANKIDVAVDNAADGAKVTITANPNLGTNIDISNNSTITNLDNRVTTNAGNITNNTSN
uniref:ESPR-type extended signal peptide-containing protein n=1 Tax=Pyramidobacter sp. TaxID=1943581 RepID=UPI00331C2997